MVAQCAGTSVPSCPSASEWPIPIVRRSFWSVADLLRGDFKPSEYGKVILPFTVLRRLDCVLSPTKGKVLTEYKTRKAAGINPEPFLVRESAQLLYTVSPLDLKAVMGDQDHIGENLRAYVRGSRPRSATSSSGSPFTRRSTSWRRPTCCIW